MKKALQFWLCLAVFAGTLFAADRDTHVLIDAEHSFAKATAERGIDGWMEFMAPNAVVLGAEPLVGLDQIRAGMGKHLATPGMKLTWEPTKAEFLGTSDDIGFVVGRWERHFSKSDGTTRILKGAYLTTWQHQKDGSWKVISDVGTSDSPSEEKTSH